MLSFLDITCTDYLIGILIQAEKKTVSTIAKNKTLVQYLKFWNGLAVKWKRFLPFSQNEETGLRFI